MMTPTNDFNHVLPPRPALHTSGGPGRLPPGDPDLGVGVGLRSNHSGAILSQRPAIPWFEVISENFMTLRNTDTESRGLPGGRPREMLGLTRKDYPIMLHGVSRTLRSTDPLRKDYLSKLKVLAEET